MRHDFSSLTANPKCKRFCKQTRENDTKIPPGCWKGSSEPLLTYCARVSSSFTTRHKLGQSVERDGGFGETLSFPPRPAQSPAQTHSKQCSRGWTPRGLSQGKGPAQGGGAHLAEQLLVPSLLHLLFALLSSMVQRPLTHTPSSCPYLPKAETRQGVRGPGQAFPSCDPTTLHVKRRSFRTPRMHAARNHS